MLKRHWILVSIAAGATALVGTAAGAAAYALRARGVATTATRDAFDPYYALVQHLMSLEPSERNPDGV